MPTPYQSEIEIALLAALATVRAEFHTFDDGSPRRPYPPAFDKVSKLIDNVNDVWEMTLEQEAYWAKLDN